MITNYFSGSKMELVDKLMEYLDNNFFIGDYE